MCPTVIDFYLPKKRTRRPGPGYGIVEKDNKLTSNNGNVYRNITRRYNDIQ